MAPSGLPNPLQEAWVSVVVIEPFLYFYEYFTGPMFRVGDMAAFPAKAAAKYVALGKVK